MCESIHIAFCADRRVLTGLHVAAYSVLASHELSESLIYVHVFSEDITSTDISSLKETLRRAETPFSIENYSVASSQFSRFPAMSGSFGTYFRLLVPEMLQVERIIYLDVDIVCHLDVSDFMVLDLGNHPAGFVAETTIRASSDRSVSDRLPKDGDKPYFNAGIMVVNRKLWLERKVTERCMEFLQAGDAYRWDQSALNYVLLDDWQQLDTRFNFISNWRKNWPALCDESQLKGKLIHFLDNPKPWDFLGEFVHPQYSLWRSVLDKTAMKDFRSWRVTSSRKFPKTRKAWNGYKKSLKDRLLFAGYSRDWIRKVKGVPNVAISH